MTLNSHPGAVQRMAAQSPFETLFQLRRKSGICPLDVSTTILASLSRSPQAYGYCCQHTAGWGSSDDAGSGPQPDDTHSLTRFISGRFLLRQRGQLGRQFLELMEVKASSGLIAYRRYLAAV